MQRSSSGRLWVPLPGSQALFLACPWREALIFGNRGPGKSLSLLWDFYRDVGRGFGPSWRGVLFRKEYKHLDDLLVKSKEFYGSVCPGARWVGGSEYRWVFPGGEELLFRAAKRKDDYWNFHGHQYPWLGWDELTNWNHLDLYEDMKSTNRSTHPGIPRRIRSATNPFGQGHNLVKRYFIDPVTPGEVNRSVKGWERVAIRSMLWENRHLIDNDPDYVQNLLAITDPNKRAAWLLGSWDITSGGMFDDLWDRRVHVIKPFPIPSSWRIDRGLDWGSSHPFAVLWFAESDGTDVTLSDGSTRSTVRGDLFVIQELYGWTGEENVGNNWTSTRVADEVKAYDVRFEGRVRPGPADTSIWEVDDGDSIGDRMQSRGVKWERANKGPGTRVSGWELIRDRLEAAAARPRENPGLFVFENCTQTLRTFPVLSRDEKNPDDVDTETEDHIADVLRYRVLAKTHRSKRGNF